MPSDILFVKTSSLGDVIHHMPAVTDARRNRPDARFTWVVEEDFAPLVMLHPAVGRVVAVNSRRWRKSLHQAGTWREAADFVAALRERHFDEIVDSQGLLRSALITRIARGRRHGYDRKSIRERLACPFYDCRHRVARRQHAVARNRALTALALGHAVTGSPDYGLDRTAIAGGPPRGYGILLHGTTRADKQWPQANWVAVGRALAGTELLLPWGTAAERLRSVALADALPQARVPERRPLDQVARLIAGAAFVIGVDTGLMHLAAALGVPLVAIFSGSEPSLTGPVGSGPIAVVGANGQLPSVETVLRAAEPILRGA